MSPARQARRDEEILTDDRTDEIGRKLEELRTMNPGKARDEVRERLIVFAQEHGYLVVTGDQRRYGIGGVGWSILRRTAANKTGSLRPFRGQLVRVACLRSGQRTARTFLVGRAEEDQIAKGPA